MRLDRSGSAARVAILSFVRILLRRIQAERWSFEAAQRSRLAADCTGHAVPTSAHPGSVPTAWWYLRITWIPSNRADRVIANAWDSTFTSSLMASRPTRILTGYDVTCRFREAGRLTSSELTMSRANKSVRLRRDGLWCLHLHPVSSR